MEERKLLSITDENSIIITAEFHACRAKDKEGVHQNIKYEIDLIVDKNITYNKLMDAIYWGLKAKASEEVRQKMFKRFTFYNKENIKGEVVSSVDENSGRSDTKELSNNENSGRSGSKESSDDKYWIKNYIDPKANMYDVCFAIFMYCYSNYIDTVSYVDKEVYPDSGDETSTLNIEYKKPVIGLASFDYKKVKDKVKLSEASQNLYDLCYLEDKNSSIDDIGFVSTSRLIFDPVAECKTGNLYDDVIVNPAFKDILPLYNISDRPLIKIDDTPINIIPPSDPPAKPNQSILAVIITPLLMVAAMIGVRFFMSNSSAASGIILISACMGVVTLVGAIINFSFNKKAYEKSVKEWKNHYEDYINELVSEIKERQKHDIESLVALYPPVYTDMNNGQQSLVKRALGVDAEIFSHGKEHPDFLKVRLGLSEGKNSELVPSIFEIKGEKKEVVFSSATYSLKQDKSQGHVFEIALNEGKKVESTNYLVDLPSNIADEYSYLRNAPVLLSLKDSRTLGIVFEGEQEFAPFINNIVFDLCYYHSPDDLQCVMFCNETNNILERQFIIENYKYLPHFRELLGDISPFAFDRNDAYLIFNKLLEIISDRKKGTAGIKYPHIIVFVMEEYELKKHAISEYLPEFEKSNEYGISFIFCKRYNEELPKYCGHVIKQTKNNKWYLLPHTQILVDDEQISKLENMPRYGFSPDLVVPQVDRGNENNRETFVRAFRIIGSIYYERIAQSSGIPSFLELFDVLGDSQSQDQEDLKKDISNFIQKSWEGSNDVTKSLRVPIGRKSEDENVDPVYLDLHEFEDGPHMLVAGTTGSGKTETILSYLIGLCTIYSPEEVNLLLMDMKGAGFVQRIGDKRGGNCLPHVVGTVTDISGDETGTDMVYMLKRFLVSMDAETKRRKILLNKMGVDSVDKYTVARKDIERHLKTHPDLIREEIKDMEPIPHLFVVIDEFTELMKISGENSEVDFKESITSLARIGRSLGFHIILISQNIENAITSDIRVNSRARLCLKVATREASKEMIDTDLAASPLMPGHGRAYLLVGNGSRFEYFQSGYSGADVTRKLARPVVVTQAETSGYYSLFFRTPDEKQEDIIDSLHQGQEKDVRKATGVTQVKFFVDRINEEFNSKKYKQPHTIFEQPLPDKCEYIFDWRERTGIWAVCETDAV